MTTTDTRVIFADELQAGTVVIQDCGIGCTALATKHHPGTPHEFTVLRARRGDDRVVNAIVLDEDGGQQPWARNPEIAIRIRVATVPESTMEERP